MDRKRRERREELGKRKERGMETRKKGELGREEGKEIKGQQWMDGWMDVFGHSASPRMGGPLGKASGERETDGL